MEYTTSKTFLDGINKDGFNREVGSGGNGYIGMSYLASGRRPDHLITIIGWDDNYSKENFNAAHRPTKNGAWLVLNSYGTGFNGGYYYISYEDTMVGKDNTGTLIVSDRDYKNVYQYDVLGSNIHIGLRANDAPLSTVYASNVFTRKDSNAEYLSEIGVHSVGNTTVDVFVNPTGTLSLTGATQVATGLTLQEEYKTIKITNPITLTGKQFAVIVKYSSTDGNSQAQIPF